MGQNILPCVVWKNTKESEHLTQIPKPHLSTSLTNISRLLFKKSQSLIMYNVISSKDMKAIKSVKQLKLIH